MIAEFNPTRLINSLLPVSRYIDTALAEKGSHKKTFGHIFLQARTCLYLDNRAPGRQLIIDTTTKLAAAVEATLGWGTVQNNIKFHIGDIHNPNFNVYLNNIKQKSKYSSKISC